MASAIIAAGKASIEIDSQETEARLVFIPEKGGDGWDIAAINKLAFDKSIRNQPDLKTLETFLAKAARAKTNEPMEMVYCSGIMPEPSIGEKVSWEALPIPGNIAPHKKEILANAAEPEVFRIRTERVKLEKKVKKPGALPFMPVKEEVEVSWEKKETRERVDVDGTVKEIRYADKGTKLGTISPSVMGKSGKSIFGRPIPPGMPEDESCLLGNGIVREKNDILADVSGFLRIGKNWADMVQFSKHTYTITTGVDGLTLFLNFIPGDERFEVPGGEEILAAAAAKGAATEGLVSAGELDEVIAGAISANEPLEAFALSRTMEAKARVDINPEKTKAVLYLRKGLAGALPLSSKAISQALKNSGVHGFDLEKLKADIKVFMEGKELVLSNYVLVEGVPSTRGRDREVEILAAFIPEDEKKLILARLSTWNERDSLKSGGYDYLNAPAGAFVEKDAVVARIRSGSEGEDGKDIYGNVIPGMPGNDPDINLVQGLEIHGSEITAAKSGLLLMDASEKSFHAMVIDYRDARIAVHISDDVMEARGDLFREEGAGVQLTIENVKKVLASLGINKGIDWEGLEKACYFARNIGSVMGYVLARGKSPLARGGSEVKWLIPLNMPEIPGAEASIQIKAGIPIVELSEPVAAGMPGYDIRGKEIPIDEGSLHIIEHDNLIREIPIGNGKRLVAARSGELKFDGKKLEIISVSTIEGNVSENIKFSGEIKITGNVLSGCSVSGGSHITIEGMAEDAVISAGGKAVVVLGFKGGHKGVLYARAGIEAAFVERGSVMAVGDIRLKKGSILSMIKTNGKLYITAENGRLTGGICQARNGVDTVDIGSEKGVRTEISFGQDYLIKEQIGVCEEEMAKDSRLIAETEATIKDLLNKDLPLPDELKNEKIRLVKMLGQCKLKLFTLREKFEEHFESEIRCKGTIYPGVVIESHNRYYEVKQKHSKVVFYFDRKTGTIRERSLE